MNLRIAVLGALRVDLGLRVPHFPVAGETVMGTHFEVFPGGAGAMCACAAARLGGTVMLLGQVGDDFLSRNLRKYLFAAGIDVSQVLNRTRGSSGLEAHLVNAAGQHLTVIAPGANATFGAPELEQCRIALESAQILLLHLDLPLPTVMAAARIAKRKGALLILDPTPPQEIPDELWSFLDYLILAEADLAFLTGAPLEDLPRSHAVQKGNELRARGAKKVIVKMGVQGALLVTENQHHQWRPLPRHPADTTAAGNLFSAAFAVALAAGRTELAAGRFGLIAVSCMNKRSATAAQLPFLAEVERKWRCHLHAEAKAPGTLP